MKYELPEIYTEIISSITGALTLDSLYEEVLLKILAFMNTENGSIALYSRATESIDFKSQVQENQWLDENQRQSHPITQEIIKYVTTHGELLNLADISQDARWADCLEMGVPRAVLCAPIVIEERVFGAIMIEGQELAPFTVEEEQILVIIGKQIALAIETYTLRDIGSILAEMPFEEILPAIAETACFLFAARSSAILLRENRADEKVQGVRYPASAENMYVIPRPGGITYAIADSGHQCDIRDVQNNQQVKPTTRARGIQAIFGMPLQIIPQHDGESGIQNIGALLIDILKDRASTAREKTILRHLAQQGVHAIEESRHARTLGALNRISLEIASAEQDIPALAETILNHAIHLVNATGGRLCLLDDTGEAVQVAFMKNPSEQIIKIKMRENSGVLGRVIATKRPFAKANYQDWTERNIDFEDHGFTAVAGVPILYQDRLWGAILAHDNTPGKVFDNNAVDVLTNLGNLAAVAFSNASRLDDLKRLIESAHVSVIAVDNQGNITQFNSRAEELLQYTKKEALGLPITEIYYYKEDAQQLKRLMLDNPGGGTTRDFITHLKSKKGHKIPIKISTSLLFDYEGKRSGSVGFFQDQRRNQAHAALASLLVKDEVLQAISDQALQITGASHSAHLALNIDNKLQVKAFHPPKKFLDMKRAPIDLDSSERIGISGRAFKTGKPQLVRDVTQNPDYICYDPETRSELAVPIIDQQGVLGVIDVQHPDMNAFSEIDQKNLETLAPFAAVAIHNAQLYHTISIDRRRFEAVANIIRETARSLPINALLRSTCHRLEKIFIEKKAVCSIRLYDPEHNVLRFDPEWHENFHHKLADHEQTTQSLDEGICGFVARTRRSKNVGNVKTDLHFKKLVPTTCSELATPIQQSEGSELIGVLDLQSPHYDAFSQSDLEFLEILADHLATDIKNGQQAQQANAEKALRRIGKAAAQPEDLQATLDEIVFQVYRLDRDGEKQINSVVLREKRGNKLRLAAAEPLEVRAKLAEHQIETSLDTDIIGISGRAAVSGKTQSVSDVSTDPNYRELHSSTKSELAIPVTTSGKVVAVLDIESAKIAAFNQEDQQIYQSLAAQVGIALSLSYQLNESARNNRHLGALYRASRIIKQGEVRSLNALLQDILELAVLQIQSEQGPKAQMSVIQLYDAERNTLSRASIYPPYADKEWQDKLGATRLLDRTPDHKIGLHGRAVLERKTQLVNDAPNDPDYIGLSDKTHSELDIPLIDEDGQILGVLGLESEELNAFDSQDQAILEGLAEMAVIAIRNFQQYEKLEEANQKLERTQAQMAARTAIALLGTERGTWRHKFVGHIGTIETIVRLLRDDIQSGAPPEKYEERLSKIEQVIAKTRTQKIAQQTSLQEVEIIELDDFIERWCDKFYWDSDVIAEGEYSCHANSPNIYVSVNEYWFNMVIENIVNNALKAMNGSAIKKLTIETAVVAENAEITITDSGPGIPQALQGKMFKEFIDKDHKEDGEGIGLVLSGIMVERFGGQIGISSTGPTGTSIVIRLPYQEQK